jgi:hypothetical protein
MTVNFDSEMSVKKAIELTPDTSALNSKQRSQRSPPFNENTTAFHRSFPSGLHRWREPDFRLRNEDCFTQKQMLLSAKRLNEH